MLKHSLLKMGHFLSVKQGQVQSKPSESSPWSEETNFSVRGSSDDTAELSVSTASDIADPDRGLDIYLNKRFLLKDVDSQPNLQLSVRDADGLAKLTVRNPGKTEDASVELTIGETDALRPELFEAGYFAGQVGEEISSVRFRPSTTSESGKHSYPHTITVNKKKVDLKPSTFGNGPRLADTLSKLDPKKLSEIQDLWKS